jgi:hypothetical protein
MVYTTSATPWGVACVLGTPQHARSISLPGDYLCMGGIIHVWVWLWVWVTSNRLTTFHMWCSVQLSWWVG